ncbi:MAG: PDZ domain-containing protein [Lachnospiraceae bacterium]|nr:PDZ domain-containing protein [Lachnospiraceae bacterium]
MDENEKIENKKSDNNISVPKPLFALLIIALCAAVCYSAYNAGYMKGLAKVQSSQEVPAVAAPEQNVDPVPQPAPEGNNNPGFDAGNFFRGMTPFNPAGNEGNAGNEKPEAPKEEQNHTQGAFLDIVASTVSDEAKESYNLPSGVLIMKVSEGGAAENAGIKAHSVITAMEGQNISSMEELKGILADKHPGDTVSVTLYEPTEDHGYEQKTITVTLSDGEAVSKER